MKAIVLSTAIALGLAAPAFANPQLERALGVAPGVYTTAELIQLKDAAEFTGNDGRVFIERGAMSFVAPATTGSSQLAASLGVSGDGLSAAQLAVLKQASEKSTNEARVVVDGTVAATTEANFGISNPRAAEILAGIRAESLENE